MQPTDIEKRKQKFRLIMPAIIIPFIALLFYSLDGGKTDVKEKTQDKPKGLNASVPSPSLDEKKPSDKMSAYQQAELEKQKTEDNSRYDPFAAWMPKPDTSDIPHPTKPETAIENKLNDLEQVLRTNDPVQTFPASSAYSTEHNRDIKNLEQIISSYQEQAPQQQNKELYQMDSMLEKILDIQYPERVAEKSKEKSGQPTPLANITTSVINYNNRFYEWENEFEVNTASSAIHAVVDKDQELISGAIAVFRIAQECYIDDAVLPVGTLVYGECALNNERLTCIIKNIQHRNNTYPVSLNVIDARDGIAGIYIPGAITREVAKESTNDAIQNLQLSSLDQNIGAQAASAAIESTKKLLTRKTKLIKATLKAGHPILLISNKNN